jgi:DGQHR domain-containing protein
MLVFSASVKMIYEHFDVSRRIEDKQQGYQRSFSSSRIKKIKNYINQDRGIIPNSILVNLDREKYSYFEKDCIRLPDTESLGLIIDG